ncbi:transposase [Nonomuraea sp. NPDC049695]|uniref:transposase n=1 Tax=Nonomuraea sp. NPDC049695 TaxID=3154734 RepID=UPI00341B6E00
MAASGGRRRCPRGDRSTPAHPSTSTQHEALEYARHEQRTDEWKTRYKVRVGVKGTISQAVDLEIRRTRYIGMAKTHLGHMLTASAINMVRLDAWLTEHPEGRPVHHTSPGSYWS